MPKTILVGFGFSAQTFHLPFLTKLETLQSQASSRPVPRTSTPSAGCDVTIRRSMRPLRVTRRYLIITTPSHHLHNEMIRQCHAKDKDL